jgi:RNA polymerase sigma-70 factor, ECF subfamily
MRVLAQSQLRRERPEHTLRPTALVHEAYLRLASKSGISCEGTSHFLGVAARLMRQLLVEHARGRSASKRGGGALKVSLDAVELLAAKACRNVVNLDDALNALAAEDPSKARIIDMRYFGGFTTDEIAAKTGVSPGILMALRKNPADRYASVDRSADDSAPLPCWQGLARAQQHLQA